jgi:hypothetical protein
MNKLYIIAIVIIIFSVAFYFYASRPDEEIMIEYADSFVTTDGFVTEVDLDGVAADGPALITLE